MNKYRKILVVLITALTVVASYAAMVRGGAGVFYDSAAAGETCTVVIPPAMGNIALMNVSYVLGTTASATYNRYPASFQSKMTSQDYNSASNFYMVADSEGKVNGHTVSASDYLIITDTSTNIAGMQFCNIDAVGAITTNGDVVVKTTIAGTASCASNDVCYLVAAADIVSETVTASAADRTYQGFGFYRMPYAITLVSTNTAVITGMYEVWQ